MHVLRNVTFNSPRWQLASLAWHAGWEWKPAKFVLSEGNKTHLCCIIKLVYYPLLMACWGQHCQTVVIISTTDAVTVTTYLIQHTQRQERLWLWQGLNVGSRHHMSFMEPFCFIWKSSFLHKGGDFHSNTDAFWIILLLVWSKGAPCLPLK